MFHRKSCTVAVLNCGVTYIMPLKSQMQGGNPRQVSTTLTTFLTKQQNTTEKSKEMSKNVRKGLKLP